MNEQASMWRARLLALAVLAFEFAQRWLIRISEAIFSPRGLALGCLLALALLTKAAWIVPPLSPKLSAFHIPLRFVFGGGPSPDELLYLPRKIHIVSLGSCLFVLYAIAAWLVYRRPSRLPGLAAFLFGVVLAANLLLSVNHPELIELLRAENGEQRRIVTMMQTEYPATLSQPYSTPFGEDDPPAVLGSIPGVAYFQYGLWSLFLLALAALFPGQGPLAKRYLRLGAFAFGGTALAALGSFPRLYGQWDWLRAQRAQLRGNMPSARRLVERAQTKSVDYTRLRPVLSFRGRLDYEEGFSTPARAVWQANQLQVNGLNPEAELLLTDAVASDPDPSLRRQAASLLTLIGLDYHRQHREGAGLERWQAAQVLGGTGLENRFYCGFLEAKWENSNARYCRSAIDPLLAWTADRPLRADLLAFEGDVLFTAGEFNASRDLYLRSMRLFNLPKTINYRAQKGLGGM